MTRLMLIHAGPTPWDEEDRLVGDESLPLSDAARLAISAMINATPGPLTAVYRAQRNEACDEVARLLEEKFELRAKDEAMLDEVNLGLWQGLRRADLRFRFATAFAQWEENPLAVTPPEAEPLEHAVDRLREGMRKILRRHRGVTVVLPLRPMAMLIVAGVLRREPIETIAAHLHKVEPAQTIEVDR